MGVAVKWNLSLPLGSPSGGAAELARLRGCPWFGGKMPQKIGTLYHSTDDTPSDLASSATYLKEGGRGASNLNLQADAGMRIVQNPAGGNGKYS